MEKRINPLKIIFKNAGYDIDAMTAQVVDSAKRRHFGALTLGDDPERPYKEIVCVRKGKDCFLGVTLKTAIKGNLLTVDNNTFISPAQFLECFSDLTLENDFEGKWHQPDGAWPVMLGPLEEKNARDLMESIFFTNIGMQACQYGSVHGGSCA